MDSAAIGRLGAALAVTSVCFLALGCSPRNDPGVAFRSWPWAICDGAGQEKPRGSREDYFTLFGDLVNDPRPPVRRFATMAICTYSYFPGKEYKFVLDAYIDYDRVDELHLKLFSAWLRAPDASVERWRMAETLVELKVREHLWKHPELGYKAGLRRRRGRWSASSGDRVQGLFAERLLAEGDEEFKMAWEDYQEYLQVLRGEKRIEGLIQLKDYGEPPGSDKKKD